MVGGAARRVLHDDRRKRTCADRSSTTASTATSTSTSTPRTRDPSSLLAWFRRALLTLRECPEFGIGTCRYVDTGDRAVLALVHDAPSGAMLAVTNLGPTKRTVDLGPQDERGRAIRSRCSPTAPTQPSGPDLDGLDIAGYGYRWIRLRRTLGARAGSSHADRQRVGRSRGIGIDGGGVQDLWCSRRTTGAVNRAGCVAQHVPHQLSGNNSRRTTRRIRSTFARWPSDPTRCSVEAGSPCSSMMNVAAHSQRPWHALSRRRSATVEPLNRSINPPTCQRRWDEPWARPTAVVSCVEASAAG